MRVLLLSPYPSTAPSNRTRVEQYLPALSRHGVIWDLVPFLSERAYRSRGLAAALGITLGLVGRVRALVNAHGYDAALVHREALPLPTAAVERLLSRLCDRLVFDFDDAIYLPQPFTANPLASLAGGPRKKFKQIVEAADLTIAGSRHLAAHAKPHSSRVTIIPTPVDTERIRPRCHGERRDTVVVGWMGSPSTAHYLTAVAPALLRLLAEQDNVELRIVGSAAPPHIGNRPRVSARPWSLQQEATDLQDFDIGIMPLPDDEWARGKCAYKALQYMSAGVATICSPVGAAKDIVTHGQNGLLAGSAEAWSEALSTLVRDPAARQAIGEAGRETAVSGYSVKACEPLFLNAVTGLESGGRSQALLEPLPAR